MAEFRLIRGVKVLEQLNQLDETTISQLQNNIRQLDTKKRQFATDPITVTNISMVPSVPSNVLEFKATTSSDGKKYDTTVMFMNVNFEDEETGLNVTFTASDDEEYNIEKINLNRTNVKVRCTCLDFYHRFAEYNSRDGSLYGKAPAPYVPKTDRASSNPRKLPGLCKHLLKTVDGLRQAGLIS